jgi:hypothetical protein
MSEIKLIEGHVEKLEELNELKKRVNELKALSNSRTPYEEMLVRINKQIDYILYFYMN